ncbi:hypothetical protein GIB67_023618 [Kingdonia uniflora]|uniref:Uncharacterized protein n=1 Tax=Kingdonia uniflora TaxID=39325 RepID=A0A7J7L547_9MAGN|nr:hypothetical protein GIB67_023618 [Kingdonia uniflora]
MSSQWIVNKPSRSDDVLDADQQLKITHEIKSHFDSMAPKRSIKPNRSELDSPNQLLPSSEEDVNDVPELDKFRLLSSMSPHPICSKESSSEVQEEFVETHYYKELNSIDKQHHTTGSGFIKVMEGSDDSNKHDLQMQREERRRYYEEVREIGYKSNPATNDWIPNIEHEVVFVSTKPNRSESCS